MDKSIDIAPLKFAVDDTLKSHAAANEQDLIDRIHQIIISINDGYDFGRAAAEEWVHYLVLVLQGNKVNLENPYSDMHHYDVKQFSQSTQHLDEVESLYILDSLPNKSLPQLREENSLLSQSILILALGGTDSTFYKGLDAHESLAFAQAFYSAAVVEAFAKYNAVELIPRGFAAKTDRMNVSVTNVESIILQAYLAGIRYIAVIANARTRGAIEEYLQNKFKNISDLHFIVTAQPLLPRMLVARSGELQITPRNGGYPGGHGHGFKYCLQDENVRDLIQQCHLRYFIFSNGDNAVVFNWGGEHFTKVIDRMEQLRGRSYDKMRIAFFLVWEYLRKGGFSFLLQDRDTGELMPQIFEAELASAGGADIEQLKKSKGGYNTNVALGFLKEAMAHLDHLPMVLKTKKMPEGVYYTFEASLATAMTTQQQENGVSKFDRNRAINILGPKTALYQQWNHIALRKRDDFFAFFSSMFKIRHLHTAFGNYATIVTERDATRKYPTLAGNVVDADILNTKEFFDLFAHADFDVDHFYGTLSINLLESKDRPRGRILFQNRIVLHGDEKTQLCFTVPAGEFWIVSDVNYTIQNIKTISRTEVTLFQWDAEERDYVYRDHDVIRQDSGQ